MTKIIVAVFFSCFSFTLFSSEVLEGRVVQLQCATIQTSQGDFWQYGQGAIITGDNVVIFHFKERTWNYLNEQCLRLQGLFDLNTEMVFLLDKSGRLLDVYPNNK